MNDVYLCLGGNIGNCVSAFTEAKTLINAKIGSIIKSSGIYRTQAWGMDNAPDFYNQVIEVKTSLFAQDVMNNLLEIEKQMGRERNIEANSYQNRVIDLDILFFNAEIIQTETVEIPHPRMHLRNFVLIPLKEIAPNLIHPILKKNISELLDVCIDKNEITKHEA